MARTSYKRSSRPAGRKGPNAVGNLHPDISLMDPRVALRLPEDDRRKNNTVIAGLDPDIYGYKALAHDMHVESNALRQSFVPQPMLRSSWPQLVMFGLGGDSWRERAISEVRGLRDERGPTQLEIYTRTSLSWIPGSRYACPRMTEEKIILSLPDLIRQSTNTRHLLTICTQKATRFDKVSRRSRCCGQAGYSLSFPCLTRESKRDIRVTRSA